jgi:23S rRNA (adenine2503-C2)-methyltransferase
MIDKLGEVADVSLAVSLHAPHDELRTQLVPLNKRWPIAQLLDACARYAARRPRTTITFEYTMMKGVNDTPTLARELARRMRGLPGKVNLIPFNPFAGPQVERSDETVIRDFQTILLNAGVQTMVRRTRGEDIDAACGQLKGKVADRTRRHAEFQRRIEAAQPTDAQADAAKVVLRHGGDGDRAGTGGVSAQSGHHQVSDADDQPRERAPRQRQAG